MDSEAVLGLPYHERRLIVVTKRPPARPDATGDAPSKFAEVIIKSPTVAALPFVASWVVGREVFKSIREMRVQGTEVLPVSFSTAQAFRFPPGHPRNNVLYVGHPVDPGSYIPAAEFHRFLFEHKVAEALRLVRSLGATTVNVRSVKGWSREAALSMGLSLPDPVAGQNVEIGGDIGHTAASRNEIITTMTLRPSNPPVVPDGLVWMPHEPLWQEIAEARLESGLRGFSLDVRSTDDFGVNASLKALVEKVHLDAGGRFVNHVETIWRLDGSFEP